MSELPNSWVSTNVLDLSFLYRGVTYSREDAYDKPQNDLIGVLRANNITEKGFDFSDLVYVPRKIVSEDQIIKSGDIVISTSSGSINVVGKANQARTDLDMSFGAFCGLIRPLKNIEPRYFGHFFRTKYYRAFISSLALGININNIKSSDFEQIEIPLPPIKEQKRIADKLDSLLARVDASREHLDQVPGILKRFRQAVLAAAMSGRLTEGGREEQKQSKEWPLRRISEITSKVGSGATPRGGEKSYKSSGIPFIRSMNVVFYAFKRDGLAFLDKKQANELRNVEVKANDILLNITGASIGRVTLAPSDMEGARVNQHVCIIRPTELVKPEYLNAYLSSPAMQQIIGAENYGVTRQALTKEQILNFEIPVPSIEEQNEIVQRIEILFAYASRLEMHYQTALLQLENLTPALLAKAFRGELVPQDPNDEPASVLLERIRAERETRAKETGQHRKSARKKTGSKVEGVMRKLTEITPTHLSDILKENGSMLPERLWAASELKIEDFYDQLKDEELKGLLKEIRNPINDLVVMLEAL